MKKLFFDVETTGTDPLRNGIHQIAGIIEIDGEVVKTFDHKIAPHPKARIEAKALEVGKVTEDQIKAYTPFKEGYRIFKNMIEMYVDRYDTSDKMYLIGFNNASFDNKFLRAMFERNDNPYFGSLFFANSPDVMCLASEYLMDRRTKMPNFKLGTVAKELGIEVKNSNLHDGLYDVEITRKIYRIVTLLEFEQ